MADVIMFPKHFLRCCGVNAPRRESCNVGNCVYCSGGLAYCLTCKGGEAELPSECPQEVMHEATRAAVSNGHLDFKGGRWVCVSDDAKALL